MRTLGLLMLTAMTTQAAVKSKVIEYDAGGTKSKGVLFWDDSVKGKLPGVIVFHEWWGLNDYAKKRAEMLAKEGYVAFCADMYGDGKTTDHPDDAGKFAGEVRKNADVWLKRAQAALAEIKKQPQVDDGKISAIGYCFGGTTAMQLFFNGADLKSVIVFHAGLPTITDEQAKKATGKLLICHGAADTFIPETVVKPFKEKLDKAGTKYEFVAYPGATHSFTVEGVEKKMPVLKYDADADKKSWESMLKLLKETSK
ncbi:dienelactone hydrolase family protein [soil metagenome]